MHICSVMHDVWHVNISSVTYSHVLCQLDRVDNHGRVVHRHMHICSVIHGVWHVDISSVTYSHVLRQLNSIDNHDRVMHRHMHICSVMHGVWHVNKCSITHRHILRQPDRVDNHGRVMHSVWHINISSVTYSHILRQPDRVDNHSSVVHSIRHIHICSVVHSIRHIHIGSVVHVVRNIDIDRVAHIHFFDRDRGRSRRCRRQFLFLGELSAERQPYRVAGVQGMNVHMGDGIEALHPIGFGDRVDSLAALHDVHIVLAAIHHLLLVAHLDRCGTRLLPPSRKARQQQRQYQQ